MIKIKVPKISSSKRNNRAIAYQNASSNRLVTFAWGILAGILCVVGILFAAKYFQPKINHKPKILANKLTTSNKTNNLSKLHKPINLTTKEQAPQHHYDFHTLLHEPQTSNNNLPINQPLVSNYPTRFILQLGKFKDHNEADALKAKLAFNGFEAKLETINSINNKNSKIYLVTIGPFKNLAEATLKQKQLTAAGVNNILIKKLNNLSISSSTSNTTKRE